MKKIVRISLLIVLLIPLRIKGLCTVEDKIRYTNLATNVVSSYDYREENGSVLFDITIHNVHKDLVVIDSLTGKKYQNNSNGLSNIVIPDLKDGKNYSFQIWAKTGDCFYRVFNTLYVSTPKYNKYYNDPVCVGASDYLLCQKWTEIGSLSYEEFKYKVEEYKKPKTEIIINEPKEEINWIYIIGDFWAKYYLYILGGILIVFIPIIIILKRRENYNF